MLSSSIRALSKCCHAFAAQLHLDEVVQAVCRMHDEGTAISQDTICALVQACSEKKDLKSARIVHSLISSHGLDSIALLADYLIRLYASHGSLFEASFVFCRASQPSVYTWHAIISAYAMHGKRHRALELYQKMQQDGIKPDKYIFVCILKVCSSLKALTQGFLAHEQIVIGRLEADVYIGCALIEMYFECGSLKTARDIFEKLPNRDVMSWNVMMMAYASCGLCHPVFELFEKMQGKGFKPNTITFSCVLKACGSSGYLGQGRLIHSEIIEMASDSLPFIQRNLLDMYAKCGSLTDANKVFNVISRGDILSWGMMIYGYVQHGQGALALEFFEKLQLEGMQPDRYIFPCVLKACGTIGAICQGRLLHDQISRTGLELDVFVGTALVDMYAKCGALEEARKVFDAIPHENIVSWNAIIAGYVQHGYGLCALQVFADLQDQRMRPDNVTYLCSLKACSSIGDLGKGMLLHDQMVRRGVKIEVVIGSTLVEMYAKQGSLEEARCVFDKLPTQDIVSWGVMITGYAHHGHGLSALEFLEKMQLEGLQPNMFIFSCAVRACADLGAIGKGRVIHSEIIRSGLESDLAVGNSLVVLYCESGSLEAACRVFDRLSSRDVASWGAMISGYAQHGSFRQTIQCFQEMQHQGVKPNGPIYVSILVACSHAGQTQKGHWYFESMRKDHSITPTVEHLSCMIDLLGRAGRLNEGLKLLKSIPATSDAIAWMCLLTACRTYSNFKLGRQCFEKVCQLDPTIAAAYVLMSNIYADAQMWECVLEIQKLRMNAGVWKKPGRAWIEVGNKVQEFLVGDETHLQNNDIYSKLEELSLLLRKEGFVPQSGSMILPFSLKEDEQDDAASCKPALGVFNIFEDTCWHDRSKATTEIRKENVLIQYVYWALFLQFLYTVLYYLRSNEFLLCRCLATLSLVTHLNHVPMLESYRLLKPI